MSLTILAQITAQPDKIDLVKAELEKLVGPTRAEPGCINYDMHQDNSDSCFFVFYENWETYDLWRDHMNSQHIAAFRKATQGAIEYCFKMR